MPTATLTSKGQLTVPKEVRDQLGLQTGDKIDFQMGEDGSARIRPATLKAADVCGMLAPYSKRKRAATVEEMRRDVAEAFRKGKL